MEPRKIERDTRHRLFQDLGAIDGIRDELRLQAHLFRAELRIAFEMLEKRWNELQVEVRALDEGKSASQEVMTKIRAMVDELREQYRRFRKRVEETR